MALKRNGPSISSVVSDDFDLIDADEVCRSIAMPRAREPHAHL